MKPLELIVADLIHNREVYLKLIEPVTSQLKELLEEQDPVFHEDIKKDYTKAIKQMFVSEAVSRLQVTAEDAMVVIDDLNIEEYLKV